MRGINFTAGTEQHCEKSDFLELGTRRVNAKMRSTCFCHASWLTCKDLSLPQHYNQPCDILFYKVEPMFERRKLILITQSTRIQIA